MIDFGAIAEAKEGKEGFPLLSYLHVYSWLGFTPFIKQYCEETGEQVCPVQQIYCNTATHMRLREFLKENWEYYPIGITSDNHPEWKKNFAKKKFSTPRELSATVRNAVQFDFQNYAPGIKEDLEDGQIIFTDGLPDDGEFFVREASGKKETSDGKHSED